MTHKGSTGKPSVIKVNSPEITNLKNLEFNADRPFIARPDEDSEFKLEEYEEEVTWTAPIVLAKDTDPEKLKISLTFSGQVCSEKTCIPIFGRKLTLLTAGSPRGSRRSSDADQMRPCGNRRTYILCRTQRTKSVKNGQRRG